MTLSTSSLRRESSYWRQGFLGIRLPLASAQVVVALTLLLRASTVGPAVLFPLLVWWTIPSIVYLMTFRTKIASWVTGLTLVGATSVLLYPQIRLLRQWDEGARSDWGPFMFPDGSIRYPFLMLLIVVGVLAVDLIVVGLHGRRRAEAERNG